MDAILKTVVDAILNGGPQAILGLGWVLFLVERYYVSAKKDAQHRTDMSNFQSDYKMLGDNLTKALNKFHVLLEVIKDRGDR